MVLSKDLKKAICFGLIIGLILSLCNLCFASESVNYTVLNGVGFNDESETFYASSSSVAYFEIEPGYTYIINNRHSYNIYVGTSPDIPSVGGSVSYVSTIGGLQQYIFTASSIKYAFIDTYVGDSSLIVTREPLVGMTNFVDNIAYSLSVGNLSSVWVLVVPILAISVLLGLGFYLLKRLLNKIKRAKGGA